MSPSLKRKLHDLSLLFQALPSSFRIPDCQKPCEKGVFAFISEIWGQHVKSSGYVTQIWAPQGRWWCNKSSKCGRGLGTRRWALRRILVEAWTALKKLFIEAFRALIKLWVRTRTDVNKCYWKLEEGRFLLWRARTLATLGPAVTGKVEKVPHPLEVLRVPACSWWLTLECQKTGKLKETVLNMEELRLAMVLKIPKSSIQ